MIFVLERKAVYHSRFMLLDQVIQATLLGVLQGITELLPISSSAHLILLPWLFDWEHLGLPFDVVIHGGTLLAILIYFHQDWREIILTIVRRFRGDSRADDNQLDLALIVGTLPAVVVALAFRPLVEDYARTPVVIVVTLSTFGLLLGWADWRGKGNRSLMSIGPRIGLIIGVAQALALIPGVSRSGVSMTAALLLGLSRTDSARFSFLLAGPIIALATLKGIQEGIGSCEGGPVLGVTFLVGVVTAFVAGLFCIKYFLRFLQTKTLMPFVFYRLGLAATILLLMLLK